MLAAINSFWMRSYIHRYIQNTLERTHEQNTLDEYVE